MFSVCTGHNALRWILNMMSQTGKLVVCRLMLSKFEFDVVHQAGVRHQAIGALSPLLTAGHDDMPLNGDVVILAISNDTISQDRSSVLTIIDAKPGWHTKRVRAKQNSVFTLEWEGTDNRNRNLRIFQLYSSSFEFPTVRISTVQLPPLILLLTSG